MTLQSPEHHVFERDYPTPDTADLINVEQELHRAVEAYRFFYPTVSMEGIFNGGREIGIEDGKNLMLLAAGPEHLVFTANSDTPYISGVLDLESMGPMVIDVPPGPYIGLVDDHHQRWILDMGIPGPDAGHGGKHLILPPGHVGAVEAGHFVGRSRTFKALLAIRALPVEGRTSALDALRRVKVYPLGDRSAALPYVDATHLPLDATPLRWERNIEYWLRLHSVINAEPVLPEHRPMYGQLAALGIEKGKEFMPSDRTRLILETAAQIGLDEMRIEGFASQREDRLVWKDRQWEWLGLVPDDANFETNDFTDLEARERWFFQAIVASPAMFRRKVGVGSIYFLAARDASGAYLDGGRSYRLTIPYPVPAKLFWSVTVYDARTRSQVQTPQGRAVRTSLEDNLEPGPGGSIVIELGPTAPAQPEKRDKHWIQTAPGTGFFLYFRIYGPQAASLDGSWKAGDVTPALGGLDRVSETKRERSRAGHGGDADGIAAISTPDTVPSRIGALHFTDGVPTEETAAKVYENLDSLRATETFLDAYSAVSLRAAHRAFVDAGVADGDVLLFSGLMDARSLFLTANCDTVYFITFLDLSRGPVVLEAPPDVLGVIDDMWFRWVSDFGAPGPDRGQGGKYLLLPPGYAGPVPEGGYYIAGSSTREVIVLGRAFLENDSPVPASGRIKQGFKTYPYSPGGTGSSVAAFLDGSGPFAADAPIPPQRFVEGTGLAINTIPPNDASFYEMLHEVVQREPASALEPEIAGQFAALGIVKGKPFEPDARMKKILGEAIALANATARTIAVRPSGPDAPNFRYYGPESAWMNPLFAGGYDFSGPPPRVTKQGVELAPDLGARHLDARTSFFYLATGNTPAMCMRMPGIGSQYVGAFYDVKGRPFDGAKTYEIELPRNVPAAKFWSLTLYDNQTRSMLQTPQRFPRAGSQAYPSPAAEPNADGSITITIGPRRPDGIGGGNWIQTVPGRGWFVLLRLYNPLEAFFDKSWRPGEVDEVG